MAEYVDETGIRYRSKRDAENCNRIELIIKDMVRETRRLRDEAYSGKRNFVIMRTAPNIYRLFVCGDRMVRSRLSSSRRRHYEFKIVSNDELKELFEIEKKIVVLELMRDNKLRDILRGD